jgi:hypothetical protein
LLERIVSSAPWRPGPRGACWSGSPAPRLRERLAGPGAGRALTVEPHGTVVCADVLPGGRRRRFAELDRHGTLLATLAWDDDGGLARAAVRAPDRAWIVIEPRVEAPAPWGRCDRLWRLGAEVPAPVAGGTPRGSSLSVFQAVAWGAVDGIPALAEPARLPPGAGSAVLNLLAALAVDQDAPALAYTGPYPTEQLFLTLLESFRYEAIDGGAPADPLAAFAAGTLRWRAAPAERLFSGEACVALRGRVEKVAWRGRTYHRPDWQAVTRHAPRRVRDAGADTVCSLWALGAPVEDHLRLDPGGEVRAVLEPPPPSGATAPIEAAVARGLFAMVAAASAPALAPEILAAGARLALEWGPVDGDLVAIGPERARLASRLRDRIAAALGQAATRADHLGVGLAALGEMAALLGDALRARAQAAVAALPPEAQAARLAAPASPGAQAGRTIAAAVAALVDGPGAGAPAPPLSSRGRSSTR